MRGSGRSQNALRPRSGVAKWGAGVSHSSLGFLKAPSRVKGKHLCEDSNPQA